MNKRARGFHQVYMELVFSEIILWAPDTMYLTTHDNKMTKRTCSKKKDGKKLIFLFVSVEETRILEARKLATPISRPSSFINAKGASHSIMIIELKAIETEFSHCHSL